MEILIIVCLAALIVDMILINKMESTVQEINERLLGLEYELHRQAKIQKHFEQEGSRG